MADKKWVRLSNHGGPMFYRIIRRFAVAALVSLFASCLAAAQKLPDAPSSTKQQAKPSASQPASASAAEKAWPRTFSSGGDSFSIYQPQVDKWEGNRIYLYSAVEVSNTAKKSANYGVIWFNARTEIDKLNRTVTLDQINLTKVNFPAGRRRTPS